MNGREYKRIKKICKEDIRAIMNRWYINVYVI